MRMLGRRRPAEEPEPVPVPVWDDGAEAERVVAWRRAALEKEGLPYPLALQIALTRVDLRTVVRALEAGMTHEQAERVFL